MKTIVLTGPTSGIGYEAARKFALKGHRLILACRQMDKANKLIEELKTINRNGDYRAIHMDLSDLESINNFIDALYASGQVIDILINNAGLYSEHRRRSKDGYELTMAANYLGTVYLTLGLLEILSGSDHARVINLVSRAGLFANLSLSDDIFTKSNKGFSAYSKSKLAEMMFTVSLSKYLKDNSITVNAVHPGTVDTSIMIGNTLMMKIVYRLKKSKMISALEASEVIVDTALSSEYNHVTGQLIESKGFIPYTKQFDDENLLKELFKKTLDELKAFNRGNFKWIEI